MDDLISRQAAIDALEWKWAGKAAFDAIKNLPSAQPEIIRCKDCKWYEGNIMGNPRGVCCHEGWVDRQYSIGFGVDEDGFCYRAELKEAE